MKFLKGYVFLSLFALLLTPKVYAGEITVLMDKLVQKGVLTPLEAQIIADETTAQVSKEIAAGKAYSVPAWVQKIKFKGDLRVRYQHENKYNSAGEEYTRDRGRYRFRLGATAKVSSGVQVGFGLATGGNDQRSTNETMDNTFSTADIRIDYAYFKWKLFGGDLYGGKFKRKPILWQATDLMWDGDVNPEGFAYSINKGIGSKLNFFANTGAFLLDEEKKNSADDTENDPIMTFVQPGIKLKLTDKVSLKAALALYRMDGVKGNLFHDDDGESAETNTLEDGGLKYEYNVINPSLQLDIKKPFGNSLPIKYLAFFGEYVNNPDPDDNNTGYALGFKFGDKKVKKPGNWQVKYIYRKLEKDAWLDTLPDSDAYGGKTGVKGHEVALTYAIKKNLLFGLDYYKMEMIEGKAKENKVIQADIMLKF